MTTEVTNQELRELQAVRFAEMKALQELLATAAHGAVTQNSACLDSKMRTTIAGILLLQRSITKLEKWSFSN